MTVAQKKEFSEFMVEVTAQLRDNTAAAELVMEAADSISQVIGQNSPFVAHMKAVVGISSGILKGIKTMTQDMSKLLKVGISNQAENSRPKGSSDNASSSVSGGRSSVSGGGDKDMLMPLLGIVAAIGAAIWAYKDEIAAKFVDGMRITKIGQGLVTAFKASKFFAAITSTFNAIANSKFFTALGKFGDDLWRVLSTIGKAAMKIIKPLVYVLGLVNPFASTLGQFTGILGKLFKVVGTLFKVAFRFFGWPITIIMGIIGAIKGAIDGYKEGGIIGAIKGALVGAFDAVIGSLLDLIKDGISWVLGKLGFEDAAAALDSFSFTDVFAKIMDFAMMPINALVGMWSGAIEGFKTGGIIGALGVLWDNTFGKIIPMIQSVGVWILEALGLDKAASMFENLDFGAAIKDTVNKVIDFLMTPFEYIMEMLDGFSIDAMIGKAVNIADSAKKMMQSVLQAVLPDPKKDRAWYDPTQLVAKALPDSVYRFAGMPLPGDKPTASVVGAGGTGISAAIGAGAVRGGKIGPMVKNTSDALSAKSSSSTNAVVVNNFNSGGNVSQITTSNVNNVNSRRAAPAYSGSGMTQLYAH